jgi:hypothetical protein
MSRDGRKPWETPIEYVEDRFPKRVFEADECDIEAILRRPDREPSTKVYGCNDTTPIN